MLIVLLKCLKRLVMEFIFSKFAGQKPATFQKKSFKGVFEGFSLDLKQFSFVFTSSRVPFCRTSFRSCFLKFYYNYQFQTLAETPPPPPDTHTHTSSKEGPVKGGPKIFQLDKGAADRFFHVQLGGQGVLGPLLEGNVLPPPAMQTKVQQDFEMHLDLLLVLSQTLRAR